MAGQRWIGAVLALLAGLIGWYFLTAQFGRIPTYFGADAIEPAYSQTFVGVVGYLMTLLGAVLGAVFRQLQRLRERKNARVTRQFLSDVMASVELWLAIAASPIAYAMIWSTLDGSNLPSLMAVAIQNGVFCHVIVGGFVEKGPQKPPRDEGV